MHARARDHSHAHPAWQSKTGLGRLATVIHPYPTVAEAIRQTGDAFNRTRYLCAVCCVAWVRSLAGLHGIVCSHARALSRSLTPTVKGLFRHLMEFQRR